MKPVRIFITSLGIVSPAGCGVDAALESIRTAAPAVKPLTLFPVSHEPPLPVGEISSIPRQGDFPRTHILALAAAREAMIKSPEAPDAVILGTTTGGISRTEELMKAGDREPRKYAFHAAGSVAEAVAREVGCRGPVLAVSTACSSGAVAVKIGMELLRSGRARRVLAGGADSLCRLTYYGFNSLQLVDPDGAHPFDRRRRGLAVGEGAVLLLLTAAETPPEGALAELLGGGLSCDAYHPAAPFPDGSGAQAAMREAAREAGITPGEIGYIHYHGTGTPDNDLAEAKAVRAFFGSTPVPPGSSTKGSYGHALAAAGALGAAIAAFSIAEGVQPVNVGLRERDPDIDLELITEAPRRAPVRVALADAFGFGGNNAALILGDPDRAAVAASSRAGRPAWFEVLGAAALTGAGDARRLQERQARNDFSGGTVPAAEIGRYLSQKSARRMKRLSRLVLSLALAACEDAPAPPASVFLGTGWGGLSETHDFLQRLFSSGERFSSPTDFIGSVHNAPAGLTAIQLKATGPNVTMTGGDCSFEQALLSATLLGDGGPLLVVGADEYHPELTPLFDPSAPLGPPSDGGGALLLRPAGGAPACRIRTSFLAYAEEENATATVSRLAACLGGDIGSRYGAVLAGIPAAHREPGRRQLEAFLAATGFSGPVIDYRRATGEFASASAAAAVLAVEMIRSGTVPLPNGNPQALDGRGILILGFGPYLTAMEVMP